MHDTNKESRGSVSGGERMVCQGLTLMRSLA